MGAQFSFSSHFRSSGELRPLLLWITGDGETRSAFCVHTVQVKRTATWTRGEQVVSVRRVSEERDFSCGVLSLSDVASCWNVAHYMLDAN